MSTARTCPVTLLLLSTAAAAAAAVSEAATALLKAGQDETNHQVQQLFYSS
jgi:hypothetical protein